METVEPVVFTKSEISISLMPYETHVQEPIDYVSYTVLLRENTKDVHTFSRAHGKEEKMYSSKKHTFCDA